MYTTRCEYEQETKDYEKEDNTCDEMEDEVDDYIQTYKSPEVIQRNSPVLSNANESNDGSERMTQSIATIELSSANKSVLCDRTFDVQLYLRDAKHRWTLNKEQAQICIFCVSHNIEIFVSVYCNSRSVKHRRMDCPVSKAIKNLKKIIFLTGTVYFFTFCTVTYTSTDNHLLKKKNNGIKNKNKFVEP
ncbi:hypothetical protein RFI_23163 [Reticulomyxa filosa]|uniref:Uncharacterized protein n=1 Tax=Reticulomyxa filosa TaxID=46433 RepID=X6MKN4_RETFI|nr:hypothetical protein RFI_23163 [Reticulomyxa filosa]|eukprot:ETO14206.1 hypothetical protein RFI_23163 [Reticulomyxa filosa]